MKKSALFVMLAAAERDIGHMARMRSDIPTANRADPSLIEAISAARAALFMEMAEYSIRQEEAELRMRTADAVAANLSPLGGYGRRYFLDGDQGTDPE